MSAPSPSPKPFSGAVLFAQIALVIAACAVVTLLPYLLATEETEIVVYSAPKETPRKVSAEATPKGEPARLWGAIVPLKNQLWFFKLTGPVEDVTKLEPVLREFLTSVQFKDGDPGWKTPEGWTKRPGNEFRFATLMIPTAGKPVELAVSKLPRSDDPLAEQLLANVNRWRGQVTLPPLNSDEFDTGTEQLDVGGNTATLVNLVGIAQPSSMGRGPFMK